MSDQPERLRIGIIGAGEIATTVHIPVLQNIAEARLEWIADMSRERAVKVASQNGARAVAVDEVASAADDCDVVLLSTALLPRAGYFDMLRDKRVTILSEKPLTLNASDHEKFALAYDERRLSVCYVRRFYGANRLLRSVVEQRPFGALRAVRVAEGGRSGRTGARHAYQDDSSQRGGGITLNLACHSLDTVLWTTQAAGYEILSKELVWDGETDRSMRGAILLKGVAGEQGQKSRLDICITNLDTIKNKIEFEFEGATLRTSIVASDECAVTIGGAPMQAKMVATTGARDSMESFYLMWRNVLAGHRERRTSEVSARSSLLTARLIDDLLAR